MTTLQQLQMQKQDLEEKRHAGDLTVQAKLTQVDRAISTRTQKIQSSQRRLAAVKQAVAAGMTKDQALRINSKTAAKRIADARAKRLLNRF